LGTNWAELTIPVVLPSTWRKNSTSLPGCWVLDFLPASYDLVVAYLPIELCFWFPKETPLLEFRPLELIGRIEEEAGGGIELCDCELGY